MVKLIKIISSLVLTLVSIVTYAQVAAAPDTIGVMRSNGKIYVVVAVVVTILLGVFVYLISLDRKITKIEKATNVDREMRL